MNKNGFSLVELVVVLAILGILMSIVTLDFNAYTRKAQIERQTRELFADINQARIDSLHRKTRHSIVLEPNSYSFKRYSSENENQSDGTVLQTRNVSYEITIENGTSISTVVTEFDIRGFTNNLGTFRINPVGTTAQVDCIIIATGRTNLGKMENGSCVYK